MSARNLKTSKTITNNKKVYYDYFVEEEYEAGLSLRGTEVKSLRKGHAIIDESFVHINNKLEAILINAHIREFSEGNINNHPADRSRKLLLHKKEIEKLALGIATKGYTIKPISLYFKKHLVKIKIGLCRGKKQYDKREKLKKRDVERAMNRFKQNFNK